LYFTTYNISVKKQLLTTCMFHTWEKRRLPTARSWGNKNEKAYLKQLGINERKIDTCIILMHVLFIFYYFVL
jgi:hypothetical protein